MKITFGVITAVLILIGLIFSRETQIEWTVYFGIGAVIVFGSAGLAFFVRRIEAIIGGIIIAAFWPILWESFQTAISTL
jgi:preprotein translocase subunit SecG